MIFFIPSTIEIPDIPPFMVCMGKTPSPMNLNDGAISEITHHDFILVIVAARSKSKLPHRIGTDAG